MIIFVRMSERRHLAIETNAIEEAWRSAGNYAKKDDEGVVYAFGEIIAGPASYEIVTAAMSMHALCSNALMPYMEWQKILKERSDRIDAINKEIQDRRKAGGV